MSLEPADVPRWATDGAATIGNPSGGVRDSGWVAGDIPPRGFVNWFWNLTYQWVIYFRDALRTWAGIENFLVQSGEATGTFKAYAIGGLDIQVTSGVTPDNRAWIGGQLVECPLLDTFLTMVPPAGAGESQVVVIAMDQNGAIGTIYGTAVVGTPADPAVSSSYIALHKIVLTQGMVTIVPGDLVDLRRWRPITDASIVPGSITAASIADDTITETQVAPKTLSQASIVDRSLNDLVKTIPQIKVGVGAAGFNVLTAGPPIYILQAPIEATFVDGSAIPTGVGSLFFAGIARVRVKVEMFREVVVSIGAHGDVVHRVRCDNTLVSDVADRVIMTYARGTGGTVPSVPAKACGYLLIDMLDPSGASEAINLNIETGLTFPGGIYVLETTPVWDLGAGGAPVAGPTTQTRISIPAVA